MDPSINIILKTALNSKYLYFLKTQFHFKRMYNIRNLLVYSWNFEVGRYIFLCKYLNAKSLTVISCVSKL